MGAWTIIVISASAVLLFVLCRKEWRRAKKARLVPRMVASAGAVVCLACMGLPIGFTKKKTNTGREILVATGGTLNDSMLSFRKNKKPGAPIVEKDAFLLGEKERYDTVHVFGYGFSNDELAMIDGQEIVFHPSPVNAGIVAASWNRQLRKGETLSVQGTYQNETGDPVVLSLIGFNANLDSVNIQSHQTKSFVLQTVPKQNGRALFSLAVRQVKDTIEKEPIPVEVLPAQNVKVMILSASPDFENKFLKDWLSQNGYGVVTKTTISKNKFDRSAFNVSNASPDRITTALLDSFDVVVSDEASLAMLPATERDVVYRQVNSKGMGLIVKSDTIASTREWYTRPFRLFQLPGKQPVHLRLSFRGNENKMLPVEQAQFIRMQNGMQALVQDSASNTVAAVVTEGAGKILFTTLNNTYAWLLSGNNGSYYALWDLLLQKAGRQNTSGSNLSITPALPVLNKPVEVILETPGETMPVVKTANAKPSFAQDPLVPYRWQTLWWPKESGWQTPFVYGDLVYNWYVYEKNDWRYLDGTARMQATENFVMRQQNSRANRVQTGGEEEKPVSPFWFFLPFIICSGFLWLERKIS